MSTAPPVGRLANVRRQVVRAARYRWTPTIIMVAASFLLAGFSIWQYQHDLHDRKSLSARLDQYQFTTQQLGESVEQLREQTIARGETPVVPPVPREVLAGQPGPVGPAGPAGKDGAPGKDGRDGTSPVVFNVAAGDGRCPYGGTGIRDASGSTAYVCNGAPGKDGAQGPAGKDGPAGAAGPQGAQGAQGPAGRDGTNGTDGATGPQGATGATGPQGPQGPPGVSPTVVYCQPPDLSGTQVCTTFPPGT